MKDYKDCPYFDGSYITSYTLHTLNTDFTPPGVLLQKLIYKKITETLKYYYSFFLLRNNTYLRILWKYILIFRIIYRKQLTYYKLTVLNGQFVVWLLVIWVIRDVRVLHDIKCKQLGAGEFPYVYLVTQKSRHIRVQSVSCNG